MHEYIKLAWRNIWRNKRRTLITAASIFFAVFIAVIMRSFQLGTYGHMTKQAIESYSGYIQIQHPDYFDDPVIDNTFVYDETMIEKISAHDNVKSIAPRVESFSLASSGLKSKGVMMVGIDSELEKGMSDPEHKLVHYQLKPEVVKSLIESGMFSSKTCELLELSEGKSYATKAKLEIDLALNKQEANDLLPLIVQEAKVSGAYLSGANDEVLVSSRLAKYLSVSVGDTLILMGQGYHGASAAGLFLVKGIVVLPSPELDNKLIYTNLKSAQNYFDLGNRVTSLAMNLYDQDTYSMNATQEELTEEIATDNYVVKNWEQLNPVLKQQIEGDDVGGQMFIAILYVIVFFGIFGTVLMMIAERRREFGVMVAIGMKKAKLARILVFEMIFIGIIGTLAGMVASSPLIILLNRNPLQMTGEMAKMYEDYGFDPIMPLEWFGPYFYLQGLVVLIMVILACIYPLRCVLKLNEVKALHSN